MKPIALLIFSLLFFLSMGCQSPPGGFTQVSTLDTLHAGNYDGITSLNDLKAFGNMGIGNFNRLNGEMVLINGDFYRLHGQGKVSVPLGSATSSYAVLTKFKPTIDKSFNRSLTFPQLKATLDALEPNQNILCFYYIRGQFSSITLRNIPAQQKPYPQMQDILFQQQATMSKNRYGTLIGVRIPAYLSGINKPGYAFHFINEARNTGGYVVDAVMPSGRIRIDTDHEFVNVILPPS